ncbi:glycosyltransferase family 2 protein [Acidovorax sp.]|uniref:glycosyltransferase family 2 protein n=1 Tax=Acidovorax sp. TaxID=1872122 RepID=UPI00391EEF70
MSQALVDVLLATYNGANYLAQQIESILAQTHQEFRILVSDDGSSDATMEILLRYRTTLGERLVLVPYPTPGRGLVRNFENLMQASLRDGVARWMAFADQDDVWLPQKLAVTLAAMARIEAGQGERVPCLVHTDLTVVDDQLTVRSASFARYQRMDPAAYSGLSLLSVNQVTGCTMMINRALLQLALPVPPEAILHDWWCAIVSGAGRRVFLIDPMILYRQHGANQVGAKDRGLTTRLMRLFTDGPGVLRRVRVLGAATYQQAQALERRLRDRGVDERAVSEYLAWRRRPWWQRLAGYRHYYVGPELDRLSRCLLWFE